MSQWNHICIIIFKWVLIFAVFFSLSFFIYGYTPAETCYVLYVKTIRLYNSLVYGIEDTSERISVTVTDHNYHINTTADVLVRQAKGAN